MRAVVIYNSQTGFTRRYGEWIAGELACEAISLQEAEREDLTPYDVIIFGSWINAGGVEKVKWFQKLMKREPEKKYAAYVVGASPMGAPMVEDTLKKAIPEEYGDTCKAFYCPGGLNYGRMSFKHRLMMKIFSKMVAGKKDQSPEEKAVAERLRHDFDIADRKYVAPVVDYVKGLGL
ncbi:MAG: flavodoxin [Ruminiclostridium sp.]|nr:flavodoxin [Ruminiclostridium sp.]